MHTIPRHIDAVVEKSTSPEYAARFVLSATSPDRIKDTIALSAYAPYAGKDLIALWAHDHTQPVGVWKNLRINGNKLIADLKVAGIALGDMVKELLAADVPLGASIGFRGRGEEKDDGGYHYKEIELLEASVVAVPMHPAAMQIAKQFGFEIHTSLKAARLQVPTFAAVVASQKSADAVAKATRAISLQRNLK